MKKLLFINGCIRTESRTERLSREYLKKLSNKCGNEYETEEICVSKLDIRPFDEEMLKKRNEDVVNGRFDGAEYALARQFATADMIVMAAPYWDCLLPAKLKVYLEHICVGGLTFAYDNKGKPVKLCKAEKLVYITTAGGYLPEHSGLESYIKELCGLLSVENTEFYVAEALDIFPGKEKTILGKTLSKMS